MRIRKYDYYPSAWRKEPEQGGIHPYMELLYIAAGNVRVYWLGRVYESSGPCLFVIPSSTPHELVCMSKSVCYLYVELEAEADDLPPSLEQAAGWNERQSQLSPPSPHEELALRAVESLRLLLTLSASPLPHDLEQAAIAAVVHTLHLVRHSVGLHESQVDATGSTDDLLSIEQIVRYLESNYWKSLPLDSLAALVHLNPDYMVRLFKQHCGRTPLQYLVDLRMKAAVSYLGNTAMTISHIAAITGFHSIHYFSRLFKQQFGESPQSWRRQHHQPQRGDKVRD